MVGWALIGLGQTAVVKADLAPDVTPNATPAPASSDATTEASESPPALAYALPYSIVGLLIILGIFVVSAPRLYPEPIRDEFQRF
jgi:hypothetical protein